MYNQSFLIGNNNKNLFKIRDHMIDNLLMKKSISNAKNRPLNSKNSLVKEHKFVQIKKPPSPKAFSKSTNKNFMPPRNLNNLNNFKKISLPLSPNSTTGKINNSNPNNNMNQYKTHNNYYNKSINLNNSDNEKFFKIHQNYKSHLLQAKKRVSISRGVTIQEENKKFGKKLDRVNSPLNKERLDQSYTKVMGYRNIAKKTDKREDISPKRFNYIKQNLPPLIPRKSKDSFINSNSIISNSNKSNILAKSFNFNYRKIEY